MGTYYAKTGTGNTPDDYTKIVWQGNRNGHIEELIPVCDICHIYDNSERSPHRFFKKRKDACLYDACEDWHLEDIQALTGIKEMKEAELNEE